MCLHVTKHLLVSLNRCPSFVLANTEALHDKIGQLSTRVRQLEDALAESHSLNSPHPHPLLSEELLQIKRPLERERLDEQTQKENHAENVDAINALGSLYDSITLSRPLLKHPFAGHYQNEDDPHSLAKLPTPG